MFKFISLTSGHVMNQAYVSKYDETFDDETSDRKQGSDSHAQPEVPSIWRENMHQEKKNCPWYSFIFSHENENRHGFQKIKIFVKGPIKPLGKLFRTPNFVFLSELQELEVRAKFPIMGK